MVNSDLDEDCDRMGHCHVDQPRIGNSQSVIMMDKFRKKNRKTKTRR